ncbi:hypothetical protein, partial [Burkholderia cepacia]|uniref:hypothetical protein n=1 Tax=Burkholderia cepacia TaxID=292 RepID=UPI0015E3BFE4
HDLQGASGDLLSTLQGPSAMTLPPVLQQPAKGRDFFRVSISFPVDHEVICIAPYDFIDVFDDVGGYPIVDIKTLEYVRDNRDAKTTVTFHISGKGCVSQVGIYKNQESP